jgi:subfamily B ATP-binding cassette protein MsbA
VGHFIEFIAAVGMLLQPLKRLTGVNEHVQRALAACESVFAVIDAPAENDRGTVALERAEGAIRFDDVTLTYRGASRPAISGVSLEIRPGETVALVGPSGGGKSSLIHLLPRFYHPEAGRITLDGHDLEALTLESLRRQLSLVSQNVVLFNDTIAANIAYGRADRVAEAEIVRAAEAAHVMEFVRGCRRARDRDRRETARSSRAASASGSPSRGRSSRTRRCSSRRGDLRPGHRERARRAGRPRGAHARAHDHRHRTPPLDR